MANLRDLWNEVCDTEQRSNKRNEKMLRQLDDLEDCVVQMSIKTDQIRRLREEFLSHAEYFHSKPLTSTPRETSKHNIGIEQITTGDETYLPNKIHDLVNHEMCSTGNISYKTQLKQSVGSFFEKVDGLPPSGSRRTSLNSSLNEPTRRQLVPQLKSNTFVYEEKFPSGAASNLQNTKKLYLTTNPVQNDIEEQSKEAVSIQRKASVSLNSNERIPLKRESIDLSHSPTEYNIPMNENISTEAIILKQKLIEENTILVKGVKESSERVDLGKFDEIVDSNEKGQTRPTLNVDFDEPLVRDMGILSVTMKETPIVTTSEKESYEQTTTAFVFEEKDLDLTVLDVGHRSVPEESSEEDEIEEQMSAAAWTTATIKNPNIAKKSTTGDKERLIIIQNDKKVDLTKRLVERMGLKKDEPQTTQVTVDEDNEFDFFN